MKLRFLVLMALLAASCESPDGIGTKDTSHTQGPPEGFRYTSNPVAYVVGSAVAANPVVTDRGAPITHFAISPATLPTGLSFDDTTGAITGTPTAAAATTVYTITAYNSYGSRFASLYLRTTTSVATHVSFTVQPSNAVAGASLSPDIQVSALGADGSVDSTFDSEITLSFANNAGSGSLLGTKSVAAVSGVSTFTGISVDTVASGYTLGAAASGLTSATSTAFNITAGAATQLRFTVQPSNAVAGASIAPAVVVKATDAFGNVNTSYSSNVTIAIGNNAGGGTLSGTTTVAAASGVATFSNLSINKSGTGYTLAATSGALNGTSSAFNITPGAATHLIFNVQPSNAVAATSIAPSVVVKALDAFNNVDTAYSANITVAIGTNPGGGTLSGTAVFPATAGSASFINLKIDKAGVGYTLTAASGALTGATSSTFDITAGGATQLKFTVQPSNTATHASISPAIQVSAVDANQNVDPTYSANITVAIGANPASGILSGTLSVPATAGVATFSNLSIDKTGNGYTLVASSGTLTNGTSSAFNILAGTATQVKFTVQPTNTAATSTISPSVQVTAYDAYNNIATSFVSNVTVAIGTNPGTGVLSGTLTRAAVAGVATFNNLSINKSGSGYTLTAASGVLSGDTSLGFNIAAAAATQLKFTVQPVNTVAGQSIIPAVQVTAYDASMNIVTSYVSNITVAIGTNPSAGTLSGTKTVAASGGVAIFPGLSIDKAGVGYTLTASSGALTTDTTSAFNITPGSATQVKFFVQPVNTVSAASIAPSVVVKAYDANMNVDTAYSANIALSIGTNPGGGTLSGTKTIAASSGVATFPGLSIDKSGVGYTLSASSAALATDTSSTFNITAGAATQIKFTVQPANTASGSSIAPSVVVTAYDANMNVATAYVSNVTVAIGTNPGAGTLGGTKTRAAVAGLATFNNLTIDKVGTGYTLAATSGALTGDTSSTFNITPGAATQVKITVQPTNALSGAAIAPAVVVKAYDANLNVVTSYGSNITLAIGTNPSAGTLSGTKTVAASSGVATFSDLNIDKAGAGYTLTASSGALTTDTSSAFNITPGAATQVKFSVQPTNTVSATSISPAVVVTAYDANMNVDTTYSGNVAVTIGTNPSSGNLSGTKTVVASSGIGTFSNLSIDLAGTGYTLSASSGALAPDTSSAFNITPGAASQLAFSVQPVNTGELDPIAPAIQVTAQDAQGNTVTGYSGNISMAIGNNAGGGTLSGTVTVAAFNGISSFNDLSIDTIGSGYTLIASAVSLASVESSAFNIVTVSATKLIFSVGPTDVTDCSSISPSVKVSAVDGSNVVDHSYSGNITVAFGTNAGGGTLSGTKTVAAVSGVATFANLSVDVPANGYTLTANAGGLVGATSSSFNVNPGAVATLTFATQPSNTRPTATINPSLVVNAYDSCSGGQLATNFSGNVTLSLSTNPPGATLGGTVTRAASAGVATFNDITVSKSSYSASGAYVIRASDGTHTVDGTAFNVGIDLVVPIELIDGGISSKLFATITYARTETGFDITKYDGTVTYSSEALCLNTDSSARNVTIVDQGGTSRGSLSVPATGALTHVTGTFTPVGTVTSLKLKLDATNGNDQLRCFMTRVLVRQQWASKTRIYRPLGALAYNYYSNTDRNDQNALDTTTEPISVNLANASTGTSNTERLHRLTFDSASLGNTVVGYTLEADCSCNANNQGAVLLTNVTSSNEVASSVTSYCPQNAIGLVSATWSSDANWISGNDFEVRSKTAAGGGTPKKWIYKSGLWIEITDLQLAPIMFRVGGYSSLSATTQQSEMGAIINTSDFAGKTGTYTVNFEVSGREPVVGASDITLFDFTSSTAIGSSNIDFGSTTKSRIREAGALSITDGDRYTIKSNVTAGTIESSGAFVIIKPQ